MFAADFHLVDKDKGGLGMMCADCHTVKQIHGDGKQYNTMFDQPTKVDCQQSNCHTNLNQEKVMHKQHHDNLDCAACHVKKVTPTCYNCHFSEQKKFDEFKFYQPPIADWKFLVKNNAGKVTSGNIQTFTTYQGKALLTVVPYFSHTIQKTSGVQCTDCHNSPAVEEYRAKGTMTLTTWDEATKKMKNMAGVIPIPPDWQTSLKLIYLNSRCHGSMGL